MPWKCSFDAALFETVRIENSINILLVAKILPPPDDEKHMCKDA
jgi:hypothetical protein